MDPSTAALLQSQAGVVTRRQLLDAGLAPHDIARLVRRRELCRLHDGVFVEHTGPPTWLQRAWSAVLLHQPAALHGVSALRAIEGPGRHREDVIHLAVARSRRVEHRSGLRIHRLDRLDDRVQWHTGPPRQRYEDAVLDVTSGLIAVAGVNTAALAELAHAVQSRRTTADRLLQRLDDRRRLAGRAWMKAVLDDVAAGACSALEHGYLALERRHGVTGARRQVVDRVGAGVVHRDVEYRCGLVVELDGRLHHDTAAQRDRDFDRDLDLRVGGRDSVRLTWGQVFDRPCVTMARIVTLLRARGWDGPAHACGPECPVDQQAGSGRWSA